MNHLLHKVFFIVPFSFLIMVLCGFQYTDGIKYQSSIKESNIVVYGTSSVHDWDIISKEISGDLIIDTLCKPNYLRSLSIRILGESFKSGKPSMDKNTYKYLDVDNYPEIMFRLDSETTFSNQDSGTIQMNGTLEVKGVIQQISLPVKYWYQMDKNYIQLIGTYSLKMTDFNIQPPELFFGAMKTGDKVDIKFNLSFKISKT